MNVRHGKGDQGLTLIEVVLAVAVLTLGFILLLGSIPSIHGTIKTNRNIAQAVHHGAAVVEEIKSLPTPSLETYIPPVITGLGTDEVITVTVIDNAGNEAVLPTDFSAIAAGIPDPVEVQVYVQWTDDRGRAKMTTVSTKRPIS
jgi:Tfp pilus assembly protein PilE